MSIHKRKLIMMAWLVFVWHKRHVQVLKSAKMCTLQTSAIVPTEDVLSYLLDKLSSKEIQIHKLPSEFELIHWLDYLPHLHADALGLLGVQALRMHVSLPSSVYFGGQYRPAVEVSIGKKKSTAEKGRPQPHDKAVYQVSKICEAYLADHWPCRTKQGTLKFLQNLYRHVQARISQLGNYCVVCGLKQEQDGLKAVPCGSQACNFAFDELGVGSGLTDIYSRPVIADLLICMASSACQCTSRRDKMLKDLPSDLCFTDKQNSEINTISQQTDWDRMLAAFKGLPSVATMAQKPNLQQFLLGTECESESEAEGDLGLALFTDGYLDRKDGEVQFRLVRSILNSCRGHIMQLQDAEKFSVMCTQHQFRLCADSPAKEAVFAERKAAKGSRFLFHGSPFHNWHCILREGLKNLSGTDMMTYGQSYGAGIYFGEFSNISARYCRNDLVTTVTYEQSIFGSCPQCIALCEVINNSFNEKTSHPANDYRVVPDAQDVITRYLFVYCDTVIPSVEACSLGDLCKTHAETQEASLQTVKKITTEMGKEPALLLSSTPAAASLSTELIDIIETSTTSRKRKNTLPSKQKAARTASSSQPKERPEINYSASKVASHTRDMTGSDVSEYEFEFSYTDSDEDDELPIAEETPFEMTAAKFNIAVAEASASLRATRY